MKNLIFLSLISIFLMTACYKIEEIKEFTVQGQILQEGSNIPIANAKIFIIKCMPDTKTLGGAQNCVHHDTIFSDNKGNYEVTVPNDEWIYSFYVTAKEHQKSQEQAVFNQKRDILLKPYAWIGIRVINEKPFNNEDIIFLKGLWLEQISPSIYFSGMNVDETIYRRHPFGNDTVRVNYSFIKNFEQSPYKELKVYSKAIDTTLVEIRY